MTTPRVSLLEAVRKYWWVIVVVTLAGGASGYGFSFLVPEQYQSATRLYLADPNAAGVFGDAPTFGSARSRVFSESEQAVSPAVLELAAERLGGGVTMESLRRRIRTDPVAELEAIRVTATGPTAEDAARTADTVATAYTDTVDQARRNSASAAVAQLDQYQTGLRDRIAGVDAELAAVRASTVAPEDATIASVLAANPRYGTLQGERSALYAELLASQRITQQTLIDTELTGSGVYRVEAAEVPEAPSRPRRVLNTQVGALLGLLCSVAFAVWLAENRQRVDDIDDPRAILDAPLLGQVPRMAPERTRGRTLPGAARWSVEGVAYQHATLMMVDGLRTLPSDSAPAAVLLTGVTSSSGVTAAAWNVGLSSARSGRRVVVIDGDLRSRDLTRLAALDHGPGLSDVIKERPDPELRSVEALGAHLPLWVVSAGSRPTDPVAFFSSSAYARALELLRRKVDLVLVDAPGVLEADETLLMAQQADAIVLVVEHGCTVQSLWETRRWLDRTGTPLLGYLFETGKLPPPGGPVEAPRDEDHEAHDSGNGEASMVTPRGRAR